MTTTTSETPSRWVTPARFLLVLIAFALWAVGCAIGSIVQAAVWSMTAVKVGYLDARRPRGADGS